MTPYKIDVIRNSQDPCNTGWVQRHLQALDLPRGAERPYRDMLRGWLEYANTHRERFESGIGGDGFLGPEWESIGRSLIRLLNGEVGRFDCGTFDALIRDTLEAEGFDPNG